MGTRKKNTKSVIPVDLDSMRKEKVYDQKSKRWMTDEEYQRKYKKRQTCKGGREHSWVMCLPNGFEATDKYKGNPEACYAMEEEIEKFTEKKAEELEKKEGIKSTYHRGFRNFRMKMRQYFCTVCKKQKYESDRIVK